MQPLRLTLFTLGLVLSTASQAAQTRMGPNTTVSFEAGKSALSNTEKDKLKKLLADARSSGKVKQVQIATWSDNFIPSGKKELSKADRKLATLRSKSIQNYLDRQLNVKDFTIHNMAERSTWLSRMFETDDAVLKTEISENPDLPMSKTEFKVFKDNGEPSSSVVLVIYNK